MLSQTLRELALLEAKDGFDAEIDPLYTEVQQRIFRETFEQSARPHLLLDPRKGLHIVDINASYEKATLTSGTKIAGCCMFEAFPDNSSNDEADGVNNLFTSLKKVAKEGLPHVMAIQRFDVRDANGVFVTQFWKPMNTAIFDTKGRLLFLLHEVEDVTEAEQRKHALDPR